MVYGNYKFPLYYTCMSVEYITLGMYYSISFQLSSCNGVKDGFYIIAGGGCKTYMYCHQGIADVFRCLPGTLFHEEEKSCVPESSVSCDHAYKQEASQSQHASEVQSDREEQIQKDLDVLKEKLERQRATKAEEDERKRQIKFRELRELLRALTVTLASKDGEQERQNLSK